MSKYTPGPWHIPPHPYPLPTVHGPDNKPVASAMLMDSALRSHDEQIKNAQLIAAAPELLEALRALLADGGPIFHEIENPMMYREIRNARALLRRLSA